MIWKLDLNSEKVKSSLVKVFYINKVIICSKVLELSDELKKNNADIVGITETRHLRESVFHRGYTDRINWWRGGVVVLVRDMWCIRD